jgi:hypothetical protein
VSLPKRISLIFAAILFWLPQFVLAASQEHHEHHVNPDSEHAHHLKPQTSQGVRLSTELLSLLNQEMVLIQKGMMDLVPAIAAGEWNKVVTIGKKIEENFILKQKLTDAQKDELHHVLPERFVEMDMDFHQSAGMLAHAAEMKNPDVVNFYFYKMNVACVSCHGKYAAERFPGLAKRGEERHHH